MTEFPETGSGWNATAGVDGGGGLAVLPGAYVGLFSSTIHLDDPSASFSVSAMFNAGPSGPVTTQEMGYPSFFALGFGDPSTNKQLGIVLNAFEDNSIDASLWTLEAPIEISTSTGPFSLSEGNWYKLNSRFAWDASNSEWLVQLEVIDFGETGTAPLETVYAASTTYGGLEAADFNDGFQIVMTAFNGSNFFTQGVTAVDNIVVVPEPSAYAAVLAGFSLCCAMRLRRRSRRA